jgi:non-homologous end joining protein Ku
MASTVWKGTISFGLVDTTRLFAAARSKRTYLHQVHSACNTRLRQWLVVQSANAALPR